MPRVLGIYTSRHSEPLAGLQSLGLEPNSLITYASGISKVFSPVDEYSSINSQRDYRIFYIRNIYPEPIVAVNPVLRLFYDYRPYLDKARYVDLATIRMRLFHPPYAQRNLVHPSITPEGTLYDNGKNLRDIIEQEQTLKNYGSAIKINVQLNQGDYVAFVVEREIQGLLPHLRDFKVTLLLSYGVST